MSETLNSQIEKLDDSQQEFIEGVKVSLEPAPVLRRIMAAAIDMGLVSAALTLLIVPLVFVFAFFGAIFFTNPSLKEHPQFMAIVIGLGFIVFVLAVMLATHAYYIYYEFKYGATIGKRVMDLRVVSVDGRRLTKGQAVYRDLVRWYVDLLVLPAAIAMALSKKRQRVGDLLAGTMVIYSQTQASRQRSMYVKSEDYQVLLAHLQPAAVDASTRRAYLTFASEAFVFGHQVQMAPEREKWLPIVRGLLPAAETLKLNDETVLRFFAEYCFQGQFEMKPKEKRNG